MSRPKRDGVDYFPFDVDFFSDRKVKIVRARYGSDGVVLYMYLLCEAYRDKGYYLQCDEDTDNLIADALGMSIDKVGQIKAYLLGRAMFDDNLFRSAEVLSSRGIQRRYQLAVKGRAVKNPVTVREDLWLLSKEETEPFIRVRAETGFSENNPDISENNPSYSKKNDTNKSKVNQSKVNKSISPAAGAADDETDDTIDWFEKLILRRSARKTERETISSIKALYTHEQIFAAIAKAVENNGQSIAYVRKVLENGTTSQHPGRYSPTYDKEDIESVLNDEFYADGNMDM